MSKEIKSLFPLSDELIKAQESVINSEYMQNLHKQMEETYEHMKQFVGSNPDISKRLLELSESIAPPQVFRFPITDEPLFIESAEVISNPDSDPEKLKKAVKNVERIVKRNPTKQTRLILEMLIPYFEDDIRYKVKSENPELNVNDWNKNIKTNFMQEIADEFELTLRRIKQIAKDYKHDYKDFLLK